MPVMGKQDALEAAKLAPTGEPLAQKNAKELATDLVKAARKALPDGIAEDSPFKTWSRDALINEAAKREITAAGMMQEEDLRLVMEHHRRKMMAAPHSSLPADAKPQASNPAVPMQPAPPPRKKIRGLKESPSNRWRVTNATPIPVSVGGGQVSTLRAGAIIERRHYSDQILEGMVAQGLKLEPIEDDADEWE